MKNIEITCPRCQGKRKFKSYKHVQAGVCFRCKGSGKVMISDWEEKQMQLKASTVVT